MTATLTTQVRRTNAYTTILLVDDAGRVVGVNRDEVAADIAAALADPRGAVAWDYNPPADDEPTDPEAWGELVEAAV